MVSPSKVQLSTPQDSYLGLIFTPTHKVITLERKQLIHSLMVPTAEDRLLSFLGRTSFLGYWISCFSLLTLPLYKASLGLSCKPLLAPINKPFCKLYKAVF